MPDHPLDAEAYAAFRKELFETGLFFDMGVDGLYGRSASYEAIVSAIRDRFSENLVPEDAATLSFPPLLARSVFDRTDYLKSFPDLMGSVHTFRGNDRDHAELIGLVESNGDWQSRLVPADVVLASAACHPLYPLNTGEVPQGGRRFEVVGYCFRCEPSVDPSRMQAFRMQESVYIGTPSGAEEHREHFLQRGVELLSGLGLDVNKVVASDPFFGRIGTMLSANQLEGALKIEVVAPICSEERPTAIMSANMHQDHFGLPFSIRTEDGEVAHSACIAFGLDRIALALLHQHGLDPEAWPAAVRHALHP